VANLTVMLEVPKWVEVGVRSGSLNIFGGVVRDNAGRIVYMLKEGTRMVPRLARGRLLLVGLGVAVAAGISYAIYKRVSNKGRTLGTLESVEKAILTYSKHAKDQHLSLDNVRQLSSELQAFIDLMESPEFQDTKITIDVDSAQKLKDFYDSLRAFNLKIREEKRIAKDVPLALATLEPCELTKQLREQLRFQEEIWWVYIEANVV
jgi:hypothetical protein